MIETLALPLPHRFAIRTLNGVLAPWLCNDEGVAQFQLFSPSRTQNVMTQLADFARMNRLCARIDSVVRDPATADLLKTWYHLFCKRPGFGDNYLQIFNRPNVTLIDTGGNDIDRLTADALYVDGRRLQIDCLIFATGFVRDQIDHGIAVDVIGEAKENFLDLLIHGARNEALKQDTLKAYSRRASRRMKGLSVPGRAA